MTLASTNIVQARDLLAATEATRPSPLRTLGAAFLAASAAVLMAGVMVLGPGVALSDTPPTASTNR